MRDISQRFAAAAVLATLAGTGCGETVPARPSAIMITIDSLRSDALGCYGNPARLTPNLDRIASQGVLYTNARTVSPLAVPAVASAMTGLYPIRHSARDDLGRPLPDEAVTLAERATAAGYETAAFVGAAVLDRGLGLAQGFALYDQPPLPSATSVSARSPERTAGEVVAAATTWLARRDHGRPFLLWLHLFDPHVPYEPPADARARAGGNAYLGEIAHVDEALGELWQALEAGYGEERIAIAIAADHGEALGQHGEVTHGALCYDATLRIPLIVRLPDGSRAGERAADITSLADLYPTLIDLLGLGDPGDVDGVSLAHGPLPVDRGTYFESYYGYLRYGWSPIAGFVDAGGKYIHGATPEFYNPTADPPEILDLIATEPGLERYRQALREVAGRPRLVDRARTDEDPGDGAPTAKLPEPLAETGLPDPRTREAEMRGVVAAMKAGEAGRYDEAILGLRAVTADNPRNWLAQGWLATYLLHQDRCAEAIPILRDLLRVGAESGSAHNSLGHCLLEGDDAAGALPHFRRASQLDPTNPIPVRNVATTLERLDRADEASVYWRRYGELGGS